jgi:hypothetical protein
MESTPEHQRQLTRCHEYPDGRVSYSSRRRILTEKRIGFNDRDRDELWIACCAASLLSGCQSWRVQLSDDDDFYLDLEFNSEADAREFYLTAPVVVDWDWITSNGFRQ